MSSAHNHALTTFASVELLPHHTYHLFLLDVVSLYTSIPHNDGLTAIQFFLDRHPHHSVATSTLVRLAELVLTLNSFEFDGTFFNQISGVAMGTKMGPSYACLFMGHLEHLMFSSFQGPIPQFYRRYIDDGFGFTDMPVEDLSAFISFVSNFHPSIKFTSIVSASSVSFLDISVSIGPVSLSTSVYYKPTDSHSFLLYSSSHPRSCRDSLPFSQLLRLRRLCQEDSDFLQHAHDMLDFFRRRAYPEDVLLSALGRVLPISRDEALSRTPRPPSSRPKLILTFHPHNIPALKILLRHFSILASDPLTKEAFPEPPLVAFRRDRNLRDTLVHSHLRPAGPPSGTSPCHRPCLTCPFVFRTSSIRFPKSVFHIHHSFSCVSRNVVYVIACKRCNLMYIGETGRFLATRFAEHLRDIRNYGSSPVALHFNSNSHRGALDIQVTGLVSCHSGDRQRFSLENRLILNLGTLKPHGINDQLYFQ